MIRKIKDLRELPGVRPLSSVTIFDGDVFLNLGEVKLVFEGYLTFKIGYPNDEIYMHEEHFVKNRLTTDVVYEITESEWLQAIVKRNAIHPSSSISMFSEFKHYVVYFQDEVLECIAERIKMVSAQ